MTREKEFATACPLLADMCSVSTIEYLLCLILNRLSNTMALDRVDFRILSFYGDSWGYY